MSVDLSEFLSGFLEEADDHLRNINANLLVLEQALEHGQPHPRVIRELFRALHTMKGLAGMVSVEPIVELAHSMERLLGDAEQAGGRLPLAAFEPLLEGTKAISQRVSALGAGNAVLEAPRELILTLDAIDVRATGAAPAQGLLVLDDVVLAKLNRSEREQLSNVSGDRRAYQIVFVPSPERATRGITITTVRERLVSLAEIVKVVPVTDKQKGTLTFLILVVSASGREELAEAAYSAVHDVALVTPTRPLRSLPEERVEGEAQVSSSAAAAVLRVDVRRIDAAMDGLGELLVAKFRLTRAVAALAARGVDVRELQQITEDMQRRLRDVRALVLGLRMISLSELLDRMPILVRGLQTTTGKAVRLSVDVGNLEVDKGVGERLWPVLVHLVRNAIDHGIESSGERLRRGKPEQGSIVVSGTKSSNSQLELTITDDGAGVDAARVAERANRPVPTDAAGLLELITTPGLSTREAVTSTSGRGMGLDIAHRITVEELGGELRLATTPGQGTTFTLRVPVTVAVVDAFRFQSAAQVFLVPVASVEELVEIEPSDVVHSPVLRERDSPAALFSRRGKTMPFVELATLLGIPQVAPSSKAIVVRRNEQLIAFGVERLIGHHEVIVRRLEDPLVDVPGVAGTADLGDGQPTLLLDLMALGRLHRETERAA